MKNGKRKKMFKKMIFTSIVYIVFYVPNNAIYI